jgi:hypothetical protein
MLLPKLDPSSKCQQFREFLVFPHNINASTDDFYVASAGFIMPTRTYSYILQNVIDIQIHAMHQLLFSHKVETWFVI